jgi:hypothetical protein
MSGTTSRGTARGLLVGRRDDYAGHWYLYGPYLPLEPRGRRAPVCGWAPVPAATAPREEAGGPRAAIARAGWEA